MFSKRKNNQTQPLEESQINALSKEHIVSEKTLNSESGFRTTKPLGSKFFIGAAILLGVILLGGLFSIFHTRTYQIGSQKVTDKDFASTQAAIKRSRDGKDAPGGKDASKKEAQDRVVLLAALKSEADKYKVAYDNKTINTYIEQEVYAKNGGKQAYVKYMSTTYGWTEADIYQVRSIEYLKGKLEKNLLQNRTYSVVYLRWDNIQQVYGKDFDKMYAEKENDLKNRILLPMKSGTSFNEIGNLVDINPNTSSLDFTKAYAKNVSPIHIVSEKPGDLQYVAYKVGENPKEKFLTTKKKGDVVGPFKSSDGRLIIARLENIDAGTYANWDDFLTKVRDEAGLNSNKQTSQSGVLKTLGSAWRLATDPFRTKQAYATKISCLGNANHNVNLTINLVDSETGVIIDTSATGSATALRYFGEGDANNGNGGCIKSEFTGALCTVGAGDYANVSCLLGFSHGTARRSLDCWGSPYSITAPVIPGYDQTSATPGYTNGNNSSATLTIKYKKKPVDTVSCSLSIIAGSASNLRKVKLTATGNTNPLKATLTSSVSDNQQDMSLPNSTSNDVKPASNGVSTYTVTITKKVGGAQVASCSASVNVNGNSVSCSISVAGPTNTYQKPYTASWTVSGAPAGATLELFGSGSGNTADVTGKSSAGVVPKEPPAGGSATTTYRLTVKNGGATLATCATNITIGVGGCNSNCDLPTVYGYVVTNFECKVDAWIVDLTKPDKKGEQLDISSPQDNPINVKPGEKYYLETTITKYRQTVYTDAWGTATAN